MKNRARIIFSIAVISLLLSSCSKKDDNNTLDRSKESTLKDIAYGTNPLQKMDIYLPKNRDASTKVILLVHGGSWSAGDKNEMNFIIPKLQEKWPGIAIANINYRLANGSDIIHTQMTEDLSDAVQHMRANHSAYSISEDMAMVGASAGAHLSLLYAYKYDTDNNIKAIGNVFGPSYFADWEFYNSFNPILNGQVKSVYVTYTGTEWNTDLYQSLSPYHIVTTSNYKPTISFHGDADIIVPVYHNRWFKAKLDSLNLTSEYYEYPGQGHGFSNEYYNDAIEKTVTFFKKHL